MIRDFNPKRRKYATDIALKALDVLNTSGRLGEFNFTLCGPGVRSSGFFKAYGNRSNFEWHEGFINHDMIKKMHNLNGVYMSPTRQDAQGVSMCEAAR